MWKLYIWATNSVETINCDKNDLKYGIFERNDLCQSLNFDFSCIWSSLKYPALWNVKHFLASDNKANAFDYAKPYCLDDTVRSYCQCPVSTDRLVPIYLIAVVWWFMVYNFVWKYRLKSRSYNLPVGHFRTTSCPSSLGIIKCCLRVINMALAFLYPTNV